MKILITTFTYPPNKDGVAEACRLMAEGLAQNGWDVTVFTGNPQHGSTTPSGPVKVERFALDRNSEGTESGRQEINRYRQQILNGGFNVVVNQCWEVWSTVYMQSIMAELPARKALVSHGYAHHIYIWHAGRSLGLLSWLRRLKWTAMNLLPMIRRYDRLLFLSHKKGYDRFFDHALASWSSHQGIEVISNGVEPPGESVDGDRFLSKHGIENRLLVLCVANFCDRKNQKLALQVFRSAAVKDSVLVFIGSEFGTYGQELKQLDARHLTSPSECDVRFMENVSRNETLDAFAACDVFLLTAKAETQPIVLLEAMAAGKPWLSTNTGCVKEMEGGWVRSGKRALVSALRELLISTQLRVTLGREGTAAASSIYTKKHVISEHDRVFRNLLK